MTVDARVGWIVVLGLTLGSGCQYQRYQTDSDRSATEQLLITESVHRAVAALELPDVAGRAVAIETVAIAGGDEKFVSGSAAARLRAEGARVVGREEAELVLAILVDTVGTVRRSLEFGIPSVPLPGGAATPSLPFLRILKQRGYTRLRTAASDATGAHAGGSPPALGRARFNLYSVFFFVLRQNDVFPGEAFQVSVD